MTAQIAGFVSRAEAGLRRPTSVSRNITPSLGGVAGHYGGTAQRINSHDDCVRAWRNWQRYHMDTHGWSDIAYTMGFCQHGYVFAGRGAGVRTAANGTNTGNQRYYAATWIGGEGQTPTRAALDAFEWCVLELRKVGAGRKVRPHNFFKSTACPGHGIRAHCAIINDRDLSTQPAPKPAPPQPPKPQPTPEETPMPPTIREGASGDDVRRMQALMVAVRHDLRIDGAFGPNTARNLVQFQRARGLKPDGVCGPNTWRRLILG